MARCLAELVTRNERLVQLGRHDSLFVLPTAQPVRVAALSRDELGQRPGAAGVVR